MDETLGEWETSVLKAYSGDKTETERVLNRTLHEAKRFCALERLPYDDGNDFSQDLGLHIFRMIDEFPNRGHYDPQIPGRASFINWLWIVMRNRVKNWYRSSSLNPLHNTKASYEKTAEDILETIPSSSGNPEESFLACEMRETLDSIVNLVNPVWQPILHMKMQGLSYQEMSQETGLGVPALRSRVFRARAEARQYRHLV